MGRPKADAPKYLPFEEAAILWECDFPSRPTLLEELIKERIQNQDSLRRLEDRKEELNVALLAFFKNNRIPGVLYEGFTLAKKIGATVTMNKEKLMLAGVKEEVIKSCQNRKDWETVECRSEREKNV